MRARRLEQALDTPARIYYKDESVSPAGSHKSNTAHAIRGAIDEAVAARESGEERVILFNYSGHGHLDLPASDDFLRGRLSEV